MSSTFWKVLAMGATAAAAVVVAKEVIERNERGDDCSPVAVIKGIGKKIGVMCGCKDCCDACDDDDFFDDFDEFEMDDDECVEFDTSDMEGDDLTAEGYIVEFNAETDPEVTDASEPKDAASEEKEAQQHENAVPEGVASDDTTETADDASKESTNKTDKKEKK